MFLPMFSGKQPLKFQKLILLMQVYPPSSIANLCVIDAELRIHIQERVPQLSTNMFNDCRRQFFHTGSICQSSIDFEPSVGEEIYTGKLILAERERARERFGLF